MYSKDKKERFENRFSMLLEEFPKCVETFDRSPAFSRPMQLKTHLATINRLREIGKASLACKDTTYVLSLYKTLQAWGIGKRGSKLADLESFINSLANAAESIKELEQFILGSNLDMGMAVSGTWNLIKRLKIVDNKNLIVSGSKTLHHLLPDLIPPIDREYTQRFFLLENPQFQYEQERTYSLMMTTFQEIAQTINLTRFIGSNWSSSSTKIIDNALVGYIMRQKTGEKLP